MRIVLAHLLCLAFAVPALAVPAQFTGRAVAVADGDTITVLTQRKQQVRIRLYGIDCPESGQPFSARAKQAASDAVFGKKVTEQPIEKEIKQKCLNIVS